MEVEACTLVLLSITRLQQNLRKLHRYGLLFCVVGHLIVSTINCISIDKGQDGPIKVSVWPLVFAIGMVVSKFMEKPDIDFHIL
ncbi:unnamed protein product [Thlaspi arvense]|uniref:Uncharacterized protein n=1 Tax=Thlaspi arvense TaxID=13288 RepID=A0AAU9RR30_THLAR|nr:unnamed protein product [Thlaspi arvense]